MVGRSDKSDRIFYKLKDAFKKIKNKRIGAECLANYGDGRAIPLLRGYTERYIDNISPDEYYEIKLAVERLGGSMEGIDIPDNWNHHTDTRHF